MDRDSNLAQWPVTGRRKEGDLHVSRKNWSCVCHQEQSASTWATSTLELHCSHSTARTKNQDAMRRPWARDRRAEFSSSTVSIHWKCGLEEDTDSMLTLQKSESSEMFPTSFCLASVFRVSASSLWPRGQQCTTEVCLRACAPVEDCRGLKPLCFFHLTTS